MPLPVRVAPLFAVFFLSCATAAPRFEQSIATTFAQDDMRHLVTRDVDVYYPAAYREAAERLAARAGECVRALRSMQITPDERSPALLFLTSANYNNAYVFGQQGGEPLHTLNPLFSTDEIFHWYGFGGTEFGDVSCHEMFHYAHYEQVENLWWAVNTVFGPVFPPQAFLERWFTEGMAQYYEGRIRRSVGRPASPLYRAAFDSFVAKREGHVGAGDLSLFQRELYPYSGAYLTSLFFIEWLAATYGEEKLWDLMDMQGRSVFSPFGATLRFKAIYGLSVGALIDAWSEHLSAQAPRRERPADQRVLQGELGQLARLATHPASGTLALITAGNEEVPKLRILERDGRVRVERRLIRIGTDREWILAGPSTMTGLSFSADGKQLYLMNDDYRDRGDTRSQLWQIDTSNGDVTRVWQDVGTGMGGALRPDGTRYTFIELTPDHAVLTDFELSTGKKTRLLELPNHVTVASVAWSPDGQRLAFSRFEQMRWQLTLLEADGTVHALPNAGSFSYGAKFSDDTHLVFADEFEGRLQVHRRDLTTGALERITDVPFGLVDPSPMGDSVAYVNREGTQWSLDVSPLVARAQVTEADSSARELSLEAGVAESDATPAVQILEPATPYSSLDHLFVPQVRSPGLSVISGPVSSASFILGATVMGRDRLARHTWLINGFLQPIPFTGSSDRFWQLDAEYRNATLAPWDLDLAGGYRHIPGDDFGSVELAMRRTVYTTQVGFGARGLISDAAGEPFRRFIGPSFDVSYAAGDSTQYAGLQRWLGLDLALAAYPKGFGSSLDMLDIGVGVTLATPLPVSRRHNLVLQLRARVLPGAPAGSLTVGGFGRGFSFNRGNAPTDVGERPVGYLPGSLSEPLRGYEDSAVRTTAAASAHLRYRYNIIIDRGFASTLYLLPSIFFRQVQLEAFASAALIDHPTTPMLRAVGGLVELKTIFMGAFALSPYYQFAYRFDGAGGPLHIVGLALD